MKENNERNNKVNAGINNMINEANSTISCNNLILFIIFLLSYSYSLFGSS